MSRMMPRGMASLVVVFLVVVATAVACGQFPLLANPGPESGMVLAVVGGTMLALAMARRGARRAVDGFLPDWLIGAGAGVVFVVVFLISTAIGAALTPTCAESGGRLALVALALPVLWLQAAVGLLVGRVVGRPGIAVVVALVVEVLAGLSLFQGFWSEPSFRVSSHFFVVVSGDLLRGAALPMAALGFRFATLLLCLTLVCFGAAWWPATRKSGLVSAQASTWYLWVAVVVGGGAFFVTHRAARASLAPSRAEMEEAYALTKTRGDLVVHADPLVTTPREVDGVLAEGTLWLERLEARLGGRAHEPIHIWLHADREAMAHFTGASHVDFALPWRRELHVAGAVLPHRSLGHELAHVVVGEKSDTLFGVPARAVVLHNPAVTEGVAMALTPELVVDDGLTLREQAAAMRRAGRAPDLRALFSFQRFFAEEPGRAYVAAGALVEQIVADAGADGPLAIARLYKGDGDLDSAVVDVDDLIDRHVQALDRTPLPKDALAFAAARFSRRSVLEETCDPDVQHEQRAIRALVRGGDVDGALARAGRLGGDADVGDATLMEVLNDVRAVGNDAAALRLFGAIEGAARTDAERAVRAFARANELWRTGSERDAVALWHQVDVDAAPVDLQRQIVAARVFGDAALRLRDAATVSRAALAFFTDNGLSRDGTRLAFAEAVGRASSEPDDVLALAGYIHGRQLILTGDLDDAVRVLRPLVDGRLLPPVFHEQAVLALATSLVRKDKPDDARPLFLSAAAAATRPADRMFFRDRADRAARAAKAPTAPAVSTSTSDPAWADRLLLGASPAGL